MPTPLLIAAMAVSLAAGVVRGFAGFGYAALTVAGLSVFVAPTQVVPAVMSLEVLASLGMMRSALTDADRGWFKALLLGRAPRRNRPQGRPQGRLPVGAYLRVRTAGWWISATPALHSGALDRGRRWPN